MRLGLHGRTRRLWAPRGVKVRQRVQIAYRWRYLALAVDPRRGRFDWAWLPNVKKETLAPAVAAWKAAGVDAVVWDGSGSHKARLVAEAGPPRVFLPPAAPELNPPERVFQELRAALEGRVYPDLDAKVAAAEATLREIAADPARVRRLTGWAWIGAALDQLPVQNPA
jgi:hypothetical protein